MYCVVDFEIYTLLEAPVLISASSALVALSSFALSYRNYSRDRGRLDVGIGVWDEVQLNEFASQPTVLNSYIRVSIVNSGRRPITLDSVGGWSRFSRVTSWLNQRISYKFKSSSYLIDMPAVRVALLDSNKEPKTLKEGERVLASVRLSGDRNEYHRTFSEVKRFFIVDTTGRRHFASKRVFNKFKADLRNKEPASKSFLFKFGKRS